MRREFRIVRRSRRGEGMTKGRLYALHQRELDTYSTHCPQSINCSGGL